MNKQTIIKHLEHSGKFLVIGKGSDKIAHVIDDLHTGGSSIFMDINTLPKKTQQTFYNLLREKDRIVIGTIQKEVKLPKIIKEKCMILRMGVE